MSPTKLGSRASTAEPCGPPSATGESARLTTGLVAAAGTLLLLAALLYDSRLLAWLDPTPPLLDSTRAAIGRSRLELAAIGGTLVGIAGLLRGSSRLGRLVGAARTPRIVVGVLALVLPLVVLELAGRPFVQPRTTLFVRDPHLGWKLRPGAVDEWLGIRLTINAKGLRGPEVAYRKPESTTRILYLGDSVTFGALVADDARIFSHLVARRLAASTGRAIEAINAGVDGYSPWQEALFLEREGLRYEPDLVVVTLVWNDLIEEAFLRGARRDVERFQLRRTATTRLERMTSRSGLFLLADRVASALGWRARADASTRLAEGLSVPSLVRDPARPEARDAWRATLGSLDRIVDLCRHSGTRLLLLRMPYRFQLDEPTPVQPMLESWIAARGVDALDLLPALSAPGGPGAKTGPSPFVDDSHLSEAGHALVAEAVARHLLAAAMPAPRDSQPMRRAIQK